MRIDEEIDGRFRNDYHRGFINLIYTTNHLTSEFEVLLKSHKLTSQQYNVLRVLRGFGPEPHSIEFLRKRMLDKKSDISRIVDKLASRGLIKKIENQTDHRQRDITITNKGLQLLLGLDDCEKQMDGLLSKLNKSEIDFLNKILDRLRQK